MDANIEEAIVTAGQALGVELKSLSKYMLLLSPDVSFLLVPQDHNNYYENKGRNFLAGLCMKLV